MTGFGRELRINGGRQGCRERDKVDGVGDGLDEHRCAGIFTQDTNPVASSRFLGEGGLFGMLQDCSVL